jgi:hypothetical protein
VRARVREMVRVMLRLVGHDGMGQGGCVGQRYGYGCSGPTGDVRRDKVASRRWRGRMLGDIDDLIGLRSACMQISVVCARSLYGSIDRDQPKPKPGQAGLYIY